MSLLDCIGRLGKSIDQDDADFMREQFNRYTENGLDESKAAQAAMKDFTEKLDVELEDIAGQVEKAGGAIQRGQEEETPLFVYDGEELVNANDVIKSFDEEIQGLDDVIRCAYK